MSLSRLSDCELDIMKILWDQTKPVSQAQIKEELEKRKGRVYGRTTVATWLARLRKKNLVQVSGQDGINFYTPVYSRKEYENMEIHLLADRLFRGSVPNILAAMTGNDTLTEDDMKEIQEIVNGWDQ